MLGVRDLGERLFRCLNRRLPAPSQQGLLEMERDHASSTQSFKFPASQRVVSLHPHRCLLALGLASTS